METNHLIQNEMKPRQKKERENCIQTKLQWFWQFGYDCQIYLIQRQEEDPETTHKKKGKKNE